QSGNGEAAILERSLVQRASGISGAELVQHCRKNGPSVIAGESITASDGVTTDSGSDTSAAVRQRRDRRIVVADGGVSGEETVLLTKIAIDPEIRLVLVVSLSAGSDKVVCA